MGESKTINEGKTLPVRHGWWKPVDEDWRKQFTWWKCSECGYDVSVKYKYCPNCCARMDKE